VIKIQNNDQEEEKPNSPGMKLPREEDITFITTSHLICVPWATVKKGK
jgi:hypothetical protein